MLKMFPFYYNLIPFLNFHSSDDQLSVCTNLNLDHPFSYNFQKLVQLLNL